MDDDAAGGLRGRRAEMSGELLAALSGRYGIEGPLDTVDLGGSSNLNLLVRNLQCIVRIYRPYVTAERLADLQLARRVLARGGVPCATLVPTRDGEPWAVVDGRLVEVERYVDSDAKMDSWQRVEAALPILGRIHTLLLDVQVGAAGRTPPFANHVSSEDALAWTLRGAQRIRSWGPSAAELVLAERAEELASTISDAERQIAPTLRTQVVHGDFWDNNVLFRDRQIALVTDFDFMGERPRIDDLALTLYFANSSLEGDPVSGERIRQLRRLVDSYQSGLEEPLSETELAALPLAIARQPLWAVGRWVALLDSEEAARRLAAEMRRDIEWAARIVRDLDRWRTAFARGAAL